jgi:hypothetical protein
MRKTAKELGMTDGLARDFANPLGFESTPETDRANATITRQSGFAEDMIVDRFGYSPESIEDRPAAPTPRAG